MKGSLLKCKSIKVAYNIRPKVSIIDREPPQLMPGYANRVLKIL